MNPATSSPKVIARLERIATAHKGRLTAESVVKDAAAPSSPLHGFFEWDDKVAGHRYRLDQARELIRSVRIEVEVDSRVIPTIKYVRDQTQEQGYVEVTSLRTDNDLARETMRAELSRVISLLERARGIAAVLGFAKEFDALLARASSLQKRAAA